MSLFGGYSIDAGYVVGAVSGGVNPDSVGLTSTGGTVFFNFNSAVGPGQKTQLMVVETNATNYNSLAVLRIDDGSGTFTSVHGVLGPVVIPESSTSLLVGLGSLVCLVARVLRSAFGAALTS
jgi:hypothetical protein